MVSLGRLFLVLARSVWRWAGISPVALCACGSGVIDWLGGVTGSDAAAAAAAAALESDPTSDLSETSARERPLEASHESEGIWRPAGRAL